VEGFIDLLMMAAMFSWLDTFKQQGVGKHDDSELD
jgi:hypothetical protein